MDVLTPVNQNEHPIPCLGVGVTQKVAVATSSAATGNTIAATTRVIRVAVTTDCYLRIGSNPTALVTDMLMPAGMVEYFRVSGGEKVAFIRNATDGIATVTEMV